jgi:serine/threonine protein kinase/Flp pilus assembly protein TadD
MICSACRHSAPDSAIACLSCGAPLPRPNDEGLTRLPTAAGLDDDGLTRLPMAAVPDDDGLTRLPLAVVPDDDGLTRLPLVAAPIDEATGFRRGLDETTWRQDTPTTAGGDAPGPSGDTGPLSPGQSFGTRYHIIKLIGLGGMGAVYQAWDAELGVVVALKVIRPEVAADPEAARELERRFKRELLLARQVTHTNVVRIHDLGELNGVKYITMPFLEGADLATVLQRDTRLPVDRVLRIARTALSGLTAAHKAGVVHRDLKPANLMITAGDDALIMDFGIARSAGDVPAGGDPASGAAAALHAAHAGHTTAGQIVGTIEYMAPEQARGETADQRSDVYAFGLILYDMLLGRRRHTHATTAIDELRQRMAGPPPRPRSIDPTVPEALEKIVMKCLAADPNARYRSSEELAEAFAALDEQGRPRPADRRLVHLIAAVSLLVVVAMFAINWWLFRPGAKVAPHDPVPVLIADFENKANETVFEGSLEHALGVAVEESSFITSYSRQDAGRLAQRIQPGAKLGSQVARLVAIREGVKYVLEGAIAAEGGGYTLTMRAVNAADGKAIWAAQTKASDRNRVLPAVRSLAVDLRKTLGDTPRVFGTESVTASSLEAVREYTIAQDLASAGRHADAIAHYQAAVARDPAFGRAYSGWATAAFYLGRKEEAEAQWKKALALTDGMTEREKYRTRGTYYLGIARNYDQAIENYSALIRLYPTDIAGHNNLAFAYFSTLNFAKAREEGDRARQLYPRNVLIGNNAALYAMYAGDFNASAEQAKGLAAQEPGFYKNYLPMAIAALAAGQFDAAAAAYAKMAAAGEVGASMASTGSSDALIYQGRAAAAVAVLRQGIAADEKAGNRDLAAVKWVALAEALDLAGRNQEAVAAARKGLAASKEMSVLVPAGRLLARLGASADAREAARQLSASLEPQTRAYGKIVEANIAAQAGQWADAVDALRAAIRLADVWLARFDLGVTYVRAGHEAEALAELDACAKRRGEASALFLDDSPTVRSLATLPYWLGRAQEGMGQEAAAQRSYAAFLALRPEPSTDPLAADARRRAR